MLYKRQGSEWVAEKLLASQEELFSTTLIAILFNDLRVVMLRLYKGAAVLSVLMKVYTIPCHDRGHNNVMLVLQSCTNSPDILPGLSHEPYATSSDSPCSIDNIEV